MREARAHAPVVDAGESVLMREPFLDFLKLVYPCYLDAMSSHGYYLSDLELLLLCECARLNAVIVMQMQDQQQFGRTVFKVHKYILPSGDSTNITLVAIHAEPGRHAVRGHYERLECLTRAVPPLPDPPERKRALSDAADGTDVDAKQGVGGRKRSLAEGADGGSGMGGNTDPKMYQPEEDRGSWA